MDNRITIISGLPRSGTSVMMQMLVEAGMTALTDDQRVADEDNPKGYYELAAVQKLQQDTAWLADARGKVLKVVSPLLAHLPDGYDYDVIFMRRDLEEIITSQSRMIANRQSDGAELNDEQLIKTYKNHLKDVYVWMGSQENVRSLSVQYRDIIEDPAAAATQVVEFLDKGLDPGSMVSAVDASLYRNRT
jgi:hypothetical protein